MAANCNLFYFITWGVVAGIICCFGFVGNMLSIVAFQRDRRSPTTTLLQCLASSDFMLLLSVFTTDSLPYICGYSHTCDNPWYTWPYIRYIWILTPISHMCSIWFVVLIAVNRFWAVCKPHSMPQVWNNGKTPIYVCAVLMIVISFNLPRFFEYRIVEKLQDDNSTIMLKGESTDFGSTMSYKVVYKVMLVNILLVVAPIVSLMVLTILILRALKLSKLRSTARKNVTQSHNDSPGNGDKDALNTSKVKPKSSSKSRAGSEITFVLVAVVIVAIVCQTPLAAFHFVRYSLQKSGQYYCGHVVFYLDNISKLLVNVNSCINFVIYSLLSPRFRKLLYITLTCGRAGQVSLSTTNTRDERETTQATHVETRIRNN